MTTFGAPNDAASHEGEGTTQLKRSLGNRHIVMIALGGIIGAGLFVGSGAVINATGPAAVLSYAVSGLLMILVIRAIGEMAVARPSSGSVASFCRDGLGDWAGFSVGWLYWYFWVIVAAIEAVAGSGILVRYIDAPGWLLCLGLILVMTGLNLLSVRAYGEAEFWLASIKIAAITFFIVVTALFLIGVIGKHHAPGLHNLSLGGGLFPMGVMAAVVGSVTVLFSMGGAEIATIAAAESKQPSAFAAKATKQVMARVFVFYVLSVLLIVLAVPWSTPFTGSEVRSPFAVVLDYVGIPYTGTIMEAVVLTAVLSSLNSCLYITSRMLVSMSEHNEAPKALVKVNKRGVPVRAIIAGTSVGYAAVIANYFFPTQVFVFLLNSSGAIQLIYYVLLVIAQIRLRRDAEREGRPLPLTMWGFPYLSYLSVAWMVVVLGFMAYDSSTRSQLALSLSSFAVIVAAFWARHFHLAHKNTPTPATRGPIDALASTAMEEK